MHSGVEFSDVEHGASYGGVGDLSFADLQPDDAIFDAYLDTHEVMDVEMDLSP